MAVRGKRGTGKPPRGIWELQFLGTCLKEGGGADTETSRALAQCKVQQQAVVHLAWVAVLGSACAQGDSAQPAAGELSHGQKLAMSSQGLQWEPNQLPKSCPGCLTGAG